MSMKLKFLIAVVLQIFILCLLWAFNYLQFIGGERVLLKLIRPRDPVSLLQGHYLRLDYDISEINKNDLSGSCDQDSDFKSGDNVYVYLAKIGNYWQAQAVCSGKSKEAGVASLKAQVIYSYADRLRLRYGIESYFIPEKNWSSIEDSFRQAKRNEDVYVEVSIGMFGNALIRKIFIGDQEIDVRAASESKEKNVFTSPVDRARDSHIIAALSQMRIVMVSLYANDGNFDDFNCQQEDMTSLCFEIINQGQEANIVVFPSVSSQEACIYTFLPSQKQWYCADSTGQSGMVNIPPSNSGFCVQGESAKCPSN